MQLLMLLVAYVTLHFSPVAHAIGLKLQVPPNIPALPASTRAYLIANNSTISTPITRTNSFVFNDLPSSHHPSDVDTSSSATTRIKTSYLLDIGCRDYEFASYGVDVKSDDTVEIYRVARGGWEQGGRVTVGDGPLELRVLKAREFYDKRGGFDPLSLLKNPMILIGIVGFAFVIGMPYLLDSMDPEMKAEFEEQQKKGILGTGGNTAANPIANFDMAAWMAGSTTTPSSSGNDREENTGALRQRRRG